ncbi:MAG TPA: LysE family transporter [Cyclobacteriaceae bacterium]|jgi:threonine/homoserine/homoserine lactone efflux protein|nr:LysE family transporter [Cyclobacteriaceae bacterium]
MLIVLKGVQLGIVLAFLVGPVFFTIIQTSVEKGFLNGALVALGVSISDILYVAICYFGLFQFLQDAGSKKNMAYAGGAILIGFGLYHLLVKAKRSKMVSFHAAAETKPLKYILKGFVINGVTPMVLIFWIGTISIATIDFGYSTGFEFFVFFTALLITVLGTDLLKAFLADKLRRLVTHRFLMIMNIVVGIFLIGFGIRLLIMAEKGLQLV